MRTIPGVTVDRVNVAGSESGQQSQFVVQGRRLQGRGVGDRRRRDHRHGRDRLLARLLHLRLVRRGQLLDRGLGCQRGHGRARHQPRCRSAAPTRSTAPPTATSRTTSCSPRTCPTGLIGDPRLQGSDKADHTDQIFDWSADLGGPIVKDKLWFYGSYGENDIRVRRLTQSQDKTRLTSYNAKLNWQPTPSDMLSLFWFQGGKEKIGRTGAAGSLVAPRGHAVGPGQGVARQPARADQARVEPHASVPASSSTSRARPTTPASTSCRRAGSRRTSG